MSLPASVTIPPDVMSRQVGDETVLLDLASGNYYGLDPVGARVWQLLSDGTPVAQLCDLIANEYDVSRERLEADVSQLLGQLADQGLLRLEPDALPRR